MPLGMLGKYERLDVLGHGVSGIVYLAKDTLLNKQIALKEVDVQAGDLRRFLEEARVMDRLRHPNIVRVNGVDRIEGKVVIDMEYVRGQNLQEILRQESALPVDRALDIAIQTLDALDYAHRMQTVHRDIKPANILIGRDGDVKLVDFGLAEILSTNAYAGGAGTYAYMAPEDFAEEDRSDHQSDIWAVGVTLYEMLTGQRPFFVAKVKDPFAWKRVLEQESPTPLAEYLSESPPALQAVLDKALSRDKRQRYQTAGAFRDDLRRLRAGESVTAPIRKSAPTPLSRLLGAPPTQHPANGMGKEEGTETIASPPAAPRTGPGVVVADVGQPVMDAPAKKSARRPRLPFTGRKGAAQLIVEPGSVDFGTVRKGEARSVKVQVRVQNPQEGIQGRIVIESPWLSAHPAAFDRARQTVTLTAHSDRAWETGEFEDAVRVETSAGTQEIPVRVAVLKPRPTFGQIALWYVPLFAASLLPSLAVAVGGGGHALSTQAASLVPSAAIASGLLAMMLLLISIVADIGIAERIACGVLIAAMATVLGVAAGNGAHSEAITVGLQRAAVTGGVIGCVLVLQLLHIVRWRLWAGALLCLSLLVSGTLLRALTG